MNNIEKCLIVFLNKELGVAWLRCDRHPITGFVHDHKRYHARVDEGFYGFYDWLRTPNGKVIGITYFCTEKLHFLEELLKTFPYSLIERKRDGSPIFSIFFSSERQIDPGSSDDQDFGYNWLFETECGEFALSFSANNIQEFLTDIDEIKSVSFAD